MKISTLFLFVILFLNTLHAKDITFITHSIEGKYYYDKNGDIRGIPHSGRRAFNIELVREMMKELNHPISFTILPFKRALHYIINNKEPYALFNIGRRESREGKMKWVGPLQVDKIYFYENSKNLTNIKNIDDAKKVKRICTLNGSFHEKFFKLNNFENIHINTSYNLCFQMLALQRVSLTVVSHNSIRSILKEAKISPNLIKNTNVLLSEIEGQIAFSNMVSDDEIMKWQKALDKLKATGKYLELEKKYLEVQ